MRRASLAVVRLLPALGLAPGTEVGSVSGQSLPAATAADPRPCVVLSVAQGPESRQAEPHAGASRQERLVRDLDQLLGLFHGQLVDRAHALDPLAQLLDLGQQLRHLAGLLRVAQAERRLRRRLTHPEKNGREALAFGYTQLTDVEQEINGLLTADRKPKADLEQLHRIITQTP